MKTRTISTIICSLYEQILDCRYSKNKDLPRNTAILFSVRVDAESMGFENDGNTRHDEWRRRMLARCYVLITTNYKVFFARGEDCLSVHESDLPTPSAWKNVSNHDSCWRHSFDSELIELCHECADWAWENVPDEHKPRSYDERFDLDLSMSMMGNKVFRLVEVDYIPDLELDSSGYHKQLTSIKFIDKELKL